MTDQTAMAAYGRNGSSPETEFDQKWPVFTAAGAGAPPAAPADQTPNVTNVLRDLLGWRPVPGDAKAFSAALTASFRLKKVEGHVESEYVPRGFAMQADLGSVTGGQASLYARAKASLTHMLELLDGLTPLQPAPDKDDIEATRILVRNELTRIIDEIGRPGGPRQPLVDSAFTVLLGPSAQDDPDPDEVEGQLGALRDRFGLVLDSVNTVEDERIRTSYWTLAEEVQDLRRAWTRWKERFADQSGFLGTDLVVISQLMEAGSEQIDEYESVLDSVLVGTAERQTIELDRNQGLTLDGLLSWTRRFLRQDGRSYLADSGRIGLEQAFQPAVLKLVQTYRRVLIGPLGVENGSKLGNGSRPPTPGLPAGLSAARSRIALASLFGLLHQIHLAAARATSALEVDGPVRLTDRTAPKVKRANDVWTPLHAAADRTDRTAAQLEDDAAKAEGEYVAKEAHKEAAIRRKDAADVVEAIALVYAQDAAAAAAAAPKSKDAIDEAARTAAEANEAAEAARNAASDAVIALNEAAAAARDAADRAKRAAGARNDATAAAKLAADAAETLRGLQVDPHELEVEATVTHIRKDAEPLLAFRSGGAGRRIPVTAHRNGGDLTGTFDYDPAALPGLAEFLADGATKRVAADDVPLLILDDGSGRELFVSRTPSWARAQLHDQGAGGGGAGAAGEAAQADWKNDPDVGRTL